MTEKEIKTIVNKYSRKAHIYVAVFLLIIIFVDYINNTSADLTTILTMMAIQVSVMLIVTFVERVLVEIFKQKNTENE